MSNAWADLTLDDLAQMGMSLDDFEQMLANGELPDLNQPDYGGLGVLAPIDISKQATQWDVLDAQKTARAATRPPSPYELRQDRSFYQPDPDAFTYDAVNQSLPYLRALLNEAISSAKPGPNQPFDVRQYVFGKVTDPEAEGYKKDDKGKTRIGKAVTSALKDFDYIADQFHSDDERWATQDPKERRALLTEWLKQEAEANLAGSAPSVSRNVNFSDWALNRRPGEDFTYGGAGFDRAGQFEDAGGRGPRIDTDRRYWGKTVTPGAEAQMSMHDFKEAYADTLAKFVSGKSGQRINDPERGGYWVMVDNSRKMTPLEAARQRMVEEQIRNRKRRGNAPSHKSWWQRNVADNFHVGPLIA